MLENPYPGRSGKIPLKPASLSEEKFLKSHPSTWFIRSEKETLCRFHENYSLFTINVLFQPLKIIFDYPEQKRNYLSNILLLKKKDLMKF